MRILFILSLFIASNAYAQSYQGYGEQMVEQMNQNAQNMPGVYYSQPMSAAPIQQPAVNMGNGVIYEPGSGPFNTTVNNQEGVLVPPMQPTYYGR
jgi:hypothetical protein